MNELLNKEIFLSALDDSFADGVHQQTKDNIKLTMDAISDSGHQVFLVGGCVRDLLMVRKPKDFDMCTDAPLETVKSVLADKGATLIDTGIEHGTITAHFENGDDFEITRFRKDVSTDGRRATVAFTNNLMDDLQRRDLTINAIAWNPFANVLEFDPEANGPEDIRRGNLKFVGNAAERVQEDHLRALRLVRFAVQFTKQGFSFNRQVWDKQILPVFDQSVLSFERIIAELEKILKVSAQLQVSSTFFVADRLTEMNLLHRVGIKQSESKELFVQMMKFGSFWPLIDAILEVNGDNVKKATEESKLPAKEIQAVGKLRRMGETRSNDKDLMLDILTQLEDIKFVREKIFDVTSLFFAGFSRIRGMKSALNEIEVKSLPFLVKHLAVDGEDLMQLGLKGREIGDTLKQLLTLVKLSNIMNNKETLIKLITLDKS